MIHFGIKRGNYVARNIESLYNIMFLMNKPVYLRKYQKIFD